jgi:hypothetical protein
LTEEAGGLGAVFSQEGHFRRPNVVFSQTGNWVTGGGGTQFCVGLLDGLFFKRRGGGNSEDSRGGSLE